MSSVDDIFSFDEPSPSPSAAMDDIISDSDINDLADALFGVCLSPGGFAGVILACIIGGLALGILIMYLVNRRKAHTIIMPNVESVQVHNVNKPQV